MKLLLYLLASAAGVANCMPAANAESEGFTETFYRADQIAGLRPNRLSRSRRSNVTPGSWAGVAQISPPSGQHYIDAYGQFVVPTVTLPSSHAPPTNYQLAVWVGIDGAIQSSQEIWQAGVQVIFNSSGAAQYSVWYEWFPNASINIPNFPVNAGDTFTVNMTMNSATKGTTVITNVSQKVRTTITGYAPGTSSNLQGATVEWVAESPTGWDVPKFSPVNFSTCQYATSGGLRQGSGVSGGSIYDIIVNSNGGSYYATNVTITSGNTFNVVYQGPS